MVEVGCSAGGDSMSAITLHLMTQRDQPCGSQRKCCEKCGVMLVMRPDTFWLKHTWTDKPEHFKRHASYGLGPLVPCNELKGGAA